MLLLLKMRHWSTNTGRIVPTTDRKDRLGEGKAAITFGYGLKVGSNGHEQPSHVLYSAAAGGDRRRSGRAGDHVRQDGRREGGRGVWHQQVSIYW
jgi:hypothetical protein